MIVARRLISFVFNLCTPFFVFAANPVTWDINISTTGQDVFWTSPTAITPRLPEYSYTYEITGLTANVALLGNRSLLGLLGETSGSGTTSAFPFEILEEMLEEPATGSSADIRIAVDASGVGHASGTNIELGSFLGLPIRRVDFMATVSIIGHPQGDYDRDGMVDVADYAVWRAEFGSTADSAADGNRNNIVDAADYVIWRDNLGTDATSGLALAAGVPEPAGWIIVTAGLTAMFLSRRERGRFAGAGNLALQHQTASGSREPTRRNLILTKAHSLQAAVRSPNRICRLIEPQSLQLT